MLRQVLLSGEQLDPKLDMDGIANRTDGYSGSDLRVLCTAAAMRPVRELLKATRKEASQVSTSLVK